MYTCSGGGCGKCLGVVPKVDTDESSRRQGVLCTPEVTGGWARISRHERHLALFQSLWSLQCGEITLTDCTTQP